MVRQPFLIFVLTLALSLPSTILAEEHSSANEPSPQPDGSSALTIADESPQDELELLILGIKNNYEDNVTPQDISSLVQRFKSLFISQGADTDAQLANKMAELDTKLQTSTLPKSAKDRLTSAIALQLASVEMLAAILEGTTPSDAQAQQLLEQWKEKNGLTPEEEKAYARQEYENRLNEPLAKAVREQIGMGDRRALEMIEKVKFALEDPSKISYAASILAANAASVPSGLRAQFEKSIRSLINSLDGARSPDDRKAPPSYTKEQVDLLNAFRTTYGLAVDHSVEKLKTLDPTQMAQLAEFNDKKLGANLIKEFQARYVPRATTYNRDSGSWAQTFTNPNATEPERKAAFDSLYNRYSGYENNIIDYLGRKESWIRQAEQNGDLTPEQLQHQKTQVARWVQVLSAIQEKNGELQGDSQSLSLALRRTDGRTAPADKVRQQGRIVQTTNDNAYALAKALHSRSGSGRGLFDLSTIRVNPNETATQANAAVPSILFLEKKEDGDDYVFVTEGEKEALALANAASGRLDNVASFGGTQSESSPNANRNAAQIAANKLGLSLKEDSQAQSPSRNDAASIAANALGITLPEASPPATQTDSNATDTEEENPLSAMLGTWLGRTTSQMFSNRPEASEETSSDEPTLSSNDNPLDAIIEWVGTPETAEVEASTPAEDQTSSSDTETSAEIDWWTGISEPAEIQAPTAVQVRNNEGF